MQLTRTNLAVRHAAGEPGDYSRWRLDTIQVTSNGDSTITTATDGKVLARIQTADEPTECPGIQFGQPPTEPVYLHSRAAGAIADLVEGESEPWFSTANIIEGAPEPRAILCRPRGIPVTFGLETGVGFPRPDFVLGITDRTPIVEFTLSGVMIEKILAIFKDFHPAFWKSKGLRFRVYGCHDQVIITAASGADDLMIAAMPMQNTISDKAERDEKSGAVVARETVE